MRRVIERRALVRLAALGLGGLSIACGRGERTSPQTTRGVAELPTQAARATTPAGGGERPPAAPTSAPVEVVRGDPVCLVTKQQGLGASYTPPDLMPLPVRVSASDGLRLRRPATEAVTALIEAAAGEGQVLFVLSAFRSFQEQDVVLQTEIRLLGRTVAERQVAPPGHSEHQLGLAVDLTTKRAPYELRAEMGQEAEGRWLTLHAPRFGYVISYPQGKEAVTGYTYEPWHIRFVGKPLAEQVSASGLTLTEFLPKHNLAGPCP